MGKVRLQVGHTLSSWGVSLLPGGDESSGVSAAAQVGDYCWKEPTTDERAQHQGAASDPDGEQSS